MTNKLFLILFISWSYISWHQFGNILFSKYSQNRWTYNKNIILKYHHWHSRCHWGNPRPRCVVVVIFSGGPPTPWAWPPSSLFTWGSFSLFSMKLAAPSPDPSPWPSPDPSPSPGCVWRRQGFGLAFTGVCLTYTVVYLAHTGVCLAYIGQCLAYTGLCLAPT